MVLADAVQRIAQTVVSVSDIWFTFRMLRTEAITDEVNDWLREYSFEYQQSVRCQTGKYSGCDWLVNYQVVSRSCTALWLLLSSRSRAVARKASEYVIAGCFGRCCLLEARQAFLLSLFDDMMDAWKLEDLNLVADVSETVMWSRSDELGHALITA